MELSEKFDVHADQFEQEGELYGRARPVRPPGLLASFATKMTGLTGVRMYDAKLHDR